MGFGLADIFSGGPPDYAAQAQAAEQQRQQNILQGTAAINKAFKGFTPAFYQKATQAYENYALPQFADQYNYTKGQIGFNLANRGLRQSSQATTQWNNLARQTAIGKQAIADQGIAQGQMLQKDVASSKNDLLNMLYQSADPAQAKAQATATASSFQIPSTFAPIANQFSGLINQYYLSQILNNRQTTPATASSSSGNFESSFAPLPPTTISAS